MTEPEILTLDEVAGVLRVSRKTVNRLVAAGRIRPIRVGRLPRVTRQELAAYIAAARRAA